MIIVQPMCGLCNRMRVIISALQLAKKKNTKLIVLWQCNKDLNASYEQLFEKQKDFYVINYKSKKDIRKRLLNKFSKSKLDNQKILDNREKGDLKKEYVDNIALPVYIRTWEQFYNAEKLLSVFKPSIELKKRIDELKKEFKPNMVAVHIRRTDQKKSIEYSKTEKFIKLMNCEIEKNPEVGFFLATDDINEEKIIRSEFPGRIISNRNRSLSRESVEGMKDAVIDLYCLASCEKIIGSYWSSFTDIAASMNGIEKIIAGLDKRNI